jgi:hypothetical protein
LTVLCTERSGEDADRERASTRLARRLIGRRAIDNALDLIRLRLDLFPHGLYQPVASLPVRAVTRATGSQSRLQAMLRVIDRLSVAHATDLGANAGFFSIELAKRGIKTIAVEAEPMIYRTTLLAVRRSGVENLGVLVLRLGPDTVDMLPETDATLFLSLWHHLVREHGLETATAMLEGIWARTGKVLFFDTGEGSEMDPSFGLPDMRPSARAWLLRYLGDTCPDARLEHLGTHLACSDNPYPRNLFAVIRSAR